jgi:hypothetical protein
MYEQKTRKTTARSRLAELRKKIDALPEATDVEKVKKEALYKELHLEYLDNILGEMERMQAGLAKREGKKSKSRR